MIMSFQNCSKVPDRTMASIEKAQKANAAPEARLSTSDKKEILKN